MVAQALACAPITTRRFRSALSTQARLSPNHLFCSQTSLSSALFALHDGVKNFSHFWVYSLTLQWR